MSKVSVPQVFPLKLRFLSHSLGTHPSVFSLNIAPYPYLSLDSFPYEHPATLNPLFP